MKCRSCGYDDVTDGEYICETGEISSEGEFKEYAGYYCPECLEFNPEKKEVKKNEMLYM
jgi:hypothetical protein